MVAVIFLLIFGLYIPSRLIQMNYTTYNSINDWVNRLDSLLSTSVVQFEGNEKRPRLVNFGTHPDCRLLVIANPQLLSGKAIINPRLKIYQFSNVTTR